MGDVVNFEGNSLNKNPLTLEAMATFLVEERVLLPSRHIVRVEHENRVKYVVVFDGEVHSEPVMQVSECYERADGTGRLYPLLKNMNPVDLGTLSEFVASENREEIYFAILDHDINAEDRDLLILIRAVEMLREKIPFSLDEFSVKSAVRLAESEWLINQSG